MIKPNNIGSKKDLKQIFQNELIKYNISQDRFYRFLFRFLSKEKTYKNYFIDIFSQFFDILLFLFPNAFNY